MKHFKNGALSEWQQIKAGAVIPFKSSKAHRVSFQVIANSAIEIWAADNSEMKAGVLQGTADDKVAVEFTAAGNSWVQVKAEKSASVFVNIRDVDQRMENSGKDSFVNIEPRVRNNDEFARIMKWVKMNEERRDAAMADERAELARLKAELSQQKSGQEPQPVPEEQVTGGEPIDATGDTAT